MDADPHHERCYGNAAHYCILLPMSGFDPHPVWKITGEQVGPKLLILSGGRGYHAWGIVICSVPCQPQVRLPAQVQTDERRGLDRRMKDLEVRLGSVLSAKALDNEEHAARIKVRAP